MNKQDLLNAISKVKPALSDGKLIEFKGLLIFDGEQLVSYGDEISVSVPLKTDFQCAVKADGFSALLSKASEANIELFIKDKEIIIQSGKTEAGFAIEDYNQESLPNLGLDQVKRWFKIPEDFIDTLKFCIFSASNDPAYGVLCNLKVEQERIVSGDNYRITEKTISKKMAGIKNYLLIPKKVASFLSQFVITDYVITETSAHYKDETGVVFSHRIVTDEYPDIDEFLSVEGESITLPSKLSEVLQRTSSIFTGSDESKVTISITNNLIEIASEKVDSWVKEPVETNYEGKDIKFNASPEHLIEILKYSNDAILGDGVILFTGKNYRHSVCLIPDEN